MKEFELPRMSCDAATEPDGVLGSGIESLGFAGRLPPAEIPGMTILESRSNLIELGVIEDITQTYGVMDERVLELFSEAQSLAWSVLCAIKDLI